jgi:hypothetical protein
MADLRSIAPLHSYLACFVLRGTLCCRMQDAGLHFLGAVPEDKLLRAVRLDEVMTALDAQYTFGSKVQLDQVCVCC